MTLKVDFLQFEGHLPDIEVKTQNAGRDYTYRLYLSQSNGFA